MKILSTKKILGPDFTGKFSQTFKQDIIPKFSRKLNRNEHFPTYSVRLALL